MQRTFTFLYDKFTQDNMYLILSQFVSFYTLYIKNILVFFGSHCICQNFVKIHAPAKLENVTGNLSKENGNFRINCMATILSPDHRCKHTLTFLFCQSFYRAAYNATHGIAVATQSVCLSVCPSVRCVHCDKTK